MESSKEIDVVNHHGEFYYLYVRTIGFQEKTSFLELYKGSPTFDACNLSQQNLMYEIDYVEYLDYKSKKKKQYIKSLSLDLDNPEKLKIVYTTDKDKGFFNVEDVRFSKEL